MPFALNVVFQSSPRVSDIGRQSCRFVCRRHSCPLVRGLPVQCRNTFYYARTSSNQVYLALGSKHSPTWLSTPNHRRRTDGYFYMGLIWETGQGPRTTPRTSWKIYRTGNSFACLVRLTGIIDLAFKGGRMDRLEPMPGLKGRTYLCWELPGRIDYR